MKQLFVWCGLLVLGLMSTISVADSFSFGISKDIKALEKINVGGVEKDQEANLLDVIKSVANWVFGILWLIALLLVMYGWVLMVTSAGEDDTYKKWWTIMRSALIWLVIIGVAWFVVSIIIWLLQKTTLAAKWSGAGTEQ